MENTKPVFQNKANRIVDCSHPVDKQAIEIYGGIEFNNTGVVDTVETVLVCTECGECVIGQEDDCPGIIF